MNAAPVAYNESYATAENTTLRRRRPGRAEPGPGSGRRPDHRRARDRASHGTLTLNVRWLVQLYAADQLPRQRQFHLPGQRRAARQQCGDGDLHGGPAAGGDNHSYATAENTALDGRRPGCADQCHRPQRQTADLPLLVANAFARHGDAQRQWVVHLHADDQFHSAPTASPTWPTTAVLDSNMATVTLDRRGARWPRTIRTGTRRTRR